MRLEDYLIQGTIHDSQIFKGEPSSVVHHRNSELEETFVNVKARKCHSIKSKVLSQEYKLEKDTYD